MEPGPSSRELAKLITEDIKRSGITPSVQTKLKLTPLTREQAKKLTGTARAGYRIPYFDIAGKQLAGFWRIRWLEERKTFGKKGGYKYHQPERSRPHVYFPPNMAWEPIVKNPDVKLTITEGEKKAAKACQEGIHCIGIGGVWSFRVQRFNKRMIEDLEQIAWQNRRVELCFDSDLMYNDQVITALNALSHELAQRGAYVSIVYIEDQNNTGLKIGLDDFLKEHGPAEYAELSRAPFAESEELYKMNENLAFIRKVGAVYDMKSGLFFQGEGRLVNMVYANHKFTAPGATGKLIEKKTVKEWLEWEHRREYDDITYAPGSPASVNDKYNVWTGWGIDPDEWVPGDLSIWNEFFDHLMQGAEPEFKKWFLQWLAYPVQYPGTKLQSAVLLWSPHQGVGKTTLASIMGQIYGHNFSKIGQDEICSQYNSWMAQKQFISCEEITSINNLSITGKMKDWITGDTVQVMEKYTPRYKIENMANFLFLSNHHDALKIEEHDRRYAIHKITQAELPKMLRKKIYAWIKSGGVKHLCYYFAQEVDLAGFSPYDRPPMTEAKNNLIMDSYTSIELWCRNLIDNPDTVLQFDGELVPGDLFLLSELKRFLVEDESLKWTTNTAFGRALGRMGVESKPIALSPGKGGTQRLYPIRNTAMWKSLLHSDWRQHYVESWKFRPDKVRAFSGPEKYRSNSGSNVVSIGDHEQRRPGRPKGSRDRGQRKRKQKRERSK